MLATFADGQVFWAFLVFFLWIIWVFLLIAVFFDIFRSPDLSGLRKALCVLGVLLVPYLGVFVYLGLRGGKMQERERASAEVQDRAFREHMRRLAENPEGRTTSEK